MKNILNIFFFLISIFSFSQTQEDKIERILNITKTIESYKEYLIEFQINPFKSEDSTKVNQILKKMTDDEIKKRIIKSFSETYSNEEIDKIYEFYNSSTGKKFITNHTFFEQKIKDNFKDIYDELQNMADEINQKNDKKNARKQNANKVKIDRENGFYEVLQYKDIVDLKTMKLSKTPFINESQILEIKNVFDDMGNLLIDIKLNNEGAQIFKKITKKNIGKPIAIVLNKTLISAPIVNAEIPEGRIQISGFSMKEADEFIKLKK